MSDVRLNDKSVASDAAYIYAETASGEQVRISKADLASVVAEQYKYASNINVDGIRINGVYRCSDNTSGTPTGYRYGFLHVTGDANWFTSQIFISTDNKMFYRSKTTEWSDWKEL